MSDPSGGVPPTAPTVPLSAGSEQAPPVPPMWTAPAASGAPAAGWGAYAPAPPTAVAPGAFGAPPPVAERRPATLGIVALVAAVAALLVSLVVGGVSLWEIGLQLVRAIGPYGSPELFTDLRFLSPARDAILVAELSFWTATALGVWGLAQGIVAIVQRRGRGTGIAAVVVAVVAPMIFAVTAYAMLVGGVFSAIPDLY